MRPWGAQWLHGGKISDGATHGAGKMDARGPPPPGARGPPRGKNKKLGLPFSSPTGDVAFCHGQVPLKRSQRSEGS